MPLTQITLSASLQTAMSATNTGFGSTTEGPDGDSFNLSGISTSTWTNSLKKQYTVLAAGTQSVDFRSFTNLVNESVTAGHILAIWVKTSGGEITMQTGASNGLVWFFGGTTPSITIPSGGIFMFSLPTSNAGQVLDGTHKVFDFVNNGGTTTTLTVIALVGP